MENRYKYKIDSTDILAGANMEANPALSLKDLTQKTLQANKEHQYALKVYTERLEDELGTVTKLLVCYISVLYYLL